MHCNGFTRSGQSRAVAARRARRRGLMHPLQNAEFVLSVANDDQLPAPGPPEIAFAGRSNAGKSSAINALANRTRLAFTSKMPGRTQQINFFRLVSGALIADLPGYGYAAVPQDLKRHWQDFLGRYVATRQSLVGLILIVDARHGISDLDVQLLSSFLPCGAPGAAARDEDGQADGIGAAHGARPRSSPESRRRFRCTRRNSPSCRSRRPGASASKAPRRRSATGCDSTRRHPRVRNANTATPKKRPRDQGECRGAQNALRRIDRYEGTRSGRKAGDVAVCENRPPARSGVPDNFCHASPDVIRGKVGVTSRRSMPAARRLLWPWRRRYDDAPFDFEPKRQVPTWDSIFPGGIPRHGCGGCGATTFRAG